MRSDSPGSYIHHGETGPQRDALQGGRSQQPLCIAAGTTDICRRHPTCRPRAWSTCSDAVPVEPQVAPAVGLADVEAVPTKRPNPGLVSLVSTQCRGGSRKSANLGRSRRYNGSRRAVRWASKGTLARRSKGCGNYVERCGSEGGSKLDAQGDLNFTVSPKNPTPEFAAMSRPFPPGSYAQIPQPEDAERRFLLVCDGGSHAQKLWPLDATQATGRNAPTPSAARRRRSTDWPCACGGN